jgi:hypothetical protein
MFSMQRAPSVLCTWWKCYDFSHNTSTGAYIVHLFHSKTSTIFSGGRPIQSSLVGQSAILRSMVTSCSRTRQPWCHFEGSEDFIFVTFRKSWRHNDLNYVSSTKECFATSANMSACAGCVSRCFYLHLVFFFFFFFSQIDLAIDYVGF